jgi:predicted DNA-binding ribbon-helix-helix protein
MMWDVLAEMALIEGRTTNGLIVQFHDEILMQQKEIPNFASFLRVTCMRYLRRNIQESKANACKLTPSSASIVPMKARVQ